MCPLSTCTIVHCPLPSHFMDLKDLQFYYAEELEQHVLFCYFQVNGNFSLDSHNLRKILPVEEWKHPLRIRVNCIPRSGNDFKLFCSLLNVVLCAQNWLLTVLSGMSCMHAWPFSQYHTLIGIRWWDPSFSLTLPRAKHVGVLTWVE